MSPSRHVTNASVLAAASELAEEKGLYHFSMQDLATRLGVKPPSLYNHIGGLDDVRKRLAKEVLRRMEDVIRNSAVGRSGQNALSEMAIAYRRFAKANPELYRAFTDSRQLQDSELEAAIQAVQGIWSQVLESYGLDPKRKFHFINLFRCGLHGFVTLEAAGFFNDSAAADDVFAELIQSNAMLLQYYQKTFEGEHNL